MLTLRKLCLGLSALGTALLFPTAVFAGIFTGSEISSSPNPATSVDQIEVIVSTFGDCPALGPITFEENNLIRMELNSTCPPPGPPQPTHQTSFVETLGPLDEGIYELRVVQSDDTLLASETLEILPEGSCLPSATVLCLRDHRFQVEVAFETLAGETGSALASALTDDSGTFTFFNQNNVELIVKALDGCSSSFSSYWFFAAGLTNVEVEITVTDLMSGQTKTYLNPIRTPFEPILDTSAFETCP